MKALPDIPLESRATTTQDTFSPPDEQGAIITQAQREQAASASHAWQGAPLHPYSIARESLFEAARAFLPLGVSQLPEKYSPPYLGVAILLLWLCAEDDKTLATLRHNADAMIDAANAWAEKNIRRGEQKAAGDLAFTILRDPTLTAAVPRPDGKGDRASGN